MRELGKCKSNGTNVYGLKECRDEIANGDKNFSSEWKGRHFEPLRLDYAQCKRCKIVQRQWRGLESDNMEERAVVT